MTNKLSNLDFMIAAQIEHPDRLRNLEICLNYLNKIGASSVYVREYYKDKPKTKYLEQKFKFNFSYNENTNNNFPRMKVINEIFKLSSGKYVVIYDTDIILSKKSLETAIEYFEKGVDVVYPYDGHFYDIPEDIVNKLYLDLNTPIDLKKCTLFNPNSIGGSTAFKRSVYKNGGGCNPNFKNTGYDDNEIFARFEKLGYIIRRTEGVLLHLNHFRGETSFNHNTFTEHNISELQKVLKMSNSDLSKYINTWSSSL